MALKTTRLTALPFSAPFFFSTSSTCQEIASPSRSGSVARIRRSSALSAAAISDRRLADLPSTSQDMSKSSSGLHRAVLGGQIADMAIGGQDGEVLAEIFVDGLGLGRGFDDDDGHSVS